MTAISLAAVAGALATFNPCGFALLPAYLTVVVRDVPSALRFTAGMATGFVAVFGLAGLVLAPLSALGRWLPVVTVVLGVALVVTGIALATGRSLGLPVHVRGVAPTAGWRSHVGYGATFALASLSCTLAPFLAATQGALRTESLAVAAGAFVAYALGMASVVGVLALLAATVGDLTRLRRATPIITRVSGVLLVLAGAYIAWYGGYELRVLAGGAGDDPVVDAALAVQGALVRLLAGLGPAVLAGAVVLGVVALWWRRRRPA